MKGLASYIERLTSELADALSERLTPVIRRAAEYEIRQALQSFAVAREAHRRVAGVFVLGETLSAPREHEPFRDEFDALGDPGEYRKHRPRPPIPERRTFFGSSSVLLESEERKQLQVLIHSPLNKGAIVVGFGACILEDVILGTEACGPWPSSSPAFLTPRVGHPGQLLVAQLKGFSW